MFTSSGTFLSSLIKLINEQANNIWEKVNIRITLAFIENPFHIFHGRAQI